MAERDLIVGIIDLALEGDLSETHLASFRVALLNALDSLEDGASDIGFLGKAHLESPKMQKPAFQEMAASDLDQALGPLTRSKVKS